VRQRYEPFDPLLIEALNDAEADVRDWAALTLARAVPVSRSFPYHRPPHPKVRPLKLLVDRLDSKEIVVRLWAVEALGDQGGEGLEALTAALKDPSKEVRARAAQVLADKSAGFAEAVPALVESLEDPDTIPRLSAAVALIKLQPESEAAIQVLRKGLRDTSHSVRCYTLRSIRDSRVKASKVIPLIEEAQEDTSPEVKALAGEALESVLR